MFIGKERVPVRLVYDPENVVFIRAKMSFGVKNRVLGAVTRITLGQSQDLAEINKSPMDLAAYNVALLTENVLGWEGPAFAGVECTPEAIADWDPDHPLVDAVLAEINRRNGGQSPKNGGSSANGSMNGGAPSSPATAKKRRGATTRT